MFSFVISNFDLSLEGCLVWYLTIIFPIDFSFLVTSCPKFNEVSRDFKITLGIAKLATRRAEFGMNAGTYIQNLVCFWRSALPLTRFELLKPGYGNSTTTRGSRRIHHVASFSDPSVLSLQYLPSLTRWCKISIPDLY